MDLIFQLLYKFFIKEKWNTIFMFVFSILVNIIQTSGISIVTANLINTVKENNQNEIYRLLYILIGLFILFSIVFYIYKLFQNKIITKLHQWIRLELITLIMKHNNENFTDKNFIQLNAPINRISSVCFMFLNDICTFLIPIIIFILVVFCYFLYHDYFMGCAFIIANLIICIFLYFIVPVAVQKNQQFEKQCSGNEAYLLEILNNMDKIVYRGQISNEIQEYKKRIDETIHKSYEFYRFMENTTFIFNCFIYLIVFVFLFYNTHKVINKEINVVLYITFFTIIILYKDKMAIVTQQIVDFIDFFGRAKAVLTHFVGINYNNELTYNTSSNLAFDKITFENVSFKYSTKDIYAFQNLNLELYLNNKIIGITGTSGKGKSTIMKLLLKMYTKYEGNIFIDDVNIRDLDPQYLRKQIVYVNQHNKLFDRLIVENMLYGCSHENTCNSHIKYIMANYPKIKELFKDNDIYSTSVGSLGEKMSGGQRSVISVITGLVTPSVGLILDEPTNGLDGALKTEILQLINAYRKEKKFIIIITHDKDVYRILDERKEL